MPTPVSVARQCLTDEAARALDDAVSVSLRRSHTQTTSLHAVSALLSLSPSSPLRSACLRSSSSRLHLRALELSVNVSLDRLPTARLAGAAPPPPPPVANSLMAAIKRSQANQRRHPDTWQLYQQLNNSSSQSANSVIKVEMKHFILSILDDPIVSRVFGEAGFRSSDLKLSIFHPPSKLPIHPPLMFNFPFAFDSGLVDDNLRKIREIMGKKKGNKRNPLLIGGFANEGLVSFTDRVRNGEIMEGVSVICLEKEGWEGGFEKLRGVLGNSSGGGVLVSVGDFGGLDEGKVLKLSEMMEGFGERLWVMGAVGSYDMYMKILGQFPCMEKDWDLQVLPITTSPSSSGGLSSKSSYMGSFVPLGGFFPSPSEFSSQLSHTNQSSRCGVCNEKYENEASAAVNGDSEASNFSDHSAKGDRTLLNAKLTVLQNKWNDICRHLHPTKPSSPDIPKTLSQYSGNPHFATNSHQSSSNKSSLDRNLYPYLITSSPMDIQRAVDPKPLLSYPTISEVSNDMSLTENHLESPCSVTSVTTDLGLGTIFAQKEPDKNKIQDHKSRLQCYSTAVSTKPGNGRNGSNCVISEQLDVRDFKSIYRLFCEKIGRQNEAISTICQAVSRCQAGLGRSRGSSRRGDIWLNFIGHDKVGKKRVALALADIIFGKKGTMISVDFASENGVRCSNSIFRGQNENKYDGKSRGKTGVDCIVDELSKNPHSVVFLENVDKADYLAQDSLLQAIRTGRVANSHRKEISISNAIFVTSSNTSKTSNESLYKKDIARFSEEKILDAKSSQMQILVRYVDDYTKNTNATNVFIVGRKESSDTNKRKLIDMNESTLDEPKRAHKASNFVLDLNIPLEEGEDIEYEISESDTDLENSKAWLEEFSDQVDENIVFQPFDFDTLSNEVLRNIDQRLRMTVGSDVVLEIDDDVAMQVMAAVWLSEKRVVENWVGHVLGRSFEEAKERCKNLNGRAVMKLVACEGVYGEEQFIGGCLPSRININ